MDELRDVEARIAYLQMIKQDSSGVFTGWCVLALARVVLFIGHQVVEQLRNGRNR